MGYLTLVFSYYKDNKIKCFKQTKIYLLCSNYLLLLKKTLTMDITTTQEFDKIINDSEKKAVLIDFWAPWCGPCRMLTPTITKLSSIYPTNVYKLNVDSVRDIASRYGVRGIPSVKIFKNGEVQETLQGVQPESVYSEKLKYYMS